jgi:hypothetical protein
VKLLEMEERRGGATKPAPSWEIISWEDGNDYIQRIDHVLQRSVITELLMGFLPLDEWGQAFMLTVEDPSKRAVAISQSRNPLCGATEEVVTAAVVAFLANVRVLLFDGPPGSTAPVGTTSSPNVPPPLFHLSISLTFI